jgi:hypothetical protein
MRILGTSLLTACGLMAIAASGAQASPEWQVGGAPMAQLETLLSSTFLAYIYVPIYGYAHFTVGHVTRTIHPSNPGTGNGRVSLSGGTMQNSKKEPIKTCTLAPMELVFEDTLVTHNGVIYDIYKPDKKGTVFGNIKLTGEACALPETLAVKGSFAYAIPTPEAIKQTMKPVSEATETLLGVGLTAGAQKAFLGGEPVEEMTGEKSKGKTWGAK